MGNVKGLYMDEIEKRDNLIQELAETLAHILDSFDMGYGLTPGYLEKAKTILHKVN